jgi:hypothetical protein
MYFNLKSILELELLRQKFELSAQLGEKIEWPIGLDSENDGEEEDEMSEEENNDNKEQLQLTSNQIEEKKKK